MTEKKIDQPEMQAHRTELWEKLHSHTGYSGSYHLFERFGIPVVVLVHLLIAAVVLSHLTWLDVVSQHPAMVEKLPTVLQGLANRWLTKGIVGIDGGLLQSLATMLFAFPAASIIVLRLLTLPAVVVLALRSPKPLQSGELEQLRQIYEKSDEMCRQTKQHSRKAARILALAGDVLLSVGYVVFWAVYRTAIGTFSVKYLLLSVAEAVLLLAAYQALYFVVMLFTLDPLELYYRHQTEKIGEEARALYQQRTEELEQEEDARQAAERARKRQEASDRIDGMLQEADVLFTEERFEEAMAAYEPLAKEMIPRGRAGYVLSKIAANMPPELSYCKPAAEELKSAVAAGLPPHVEAASSKVLESLIQTIREQVTPRFLRAKELQALDHPEIAVQMLREAAELGLPEAVPAYVRAEMENHAPLKKYGEFIKLMESAHRFGFANEAARKEYDDLMDGLYWTYGKYLTDQGQTHAGGYYILAAANLGNSSAKAYLNPVEEVQEPVSAAD